MVGVVQRCGHGIQPCALIFLNLINALHALSLQAPSSPQRQKRRPSTAIEAQVLRSELEQRSEEIQTLKEQLRAEAVGWGRGSHD